MASPKNDIGSSASDDDVD
ncbi:unnamed protein product, partial [Allacma fusca]